LQDRILEIVAYMMSCLTDLQGGISGIDEMSADLRSQGFTDTEISSAYNWLIKHFEDYPRSFAVKGKRAGSKSVRILSDNERRMISPEAYGYLLQLRHLGLLTIEQMEIILDRCLLLPTDQMDIDEVKYLASAAMFDLSSGDLPYTVWIGDPESEPIN